MKIRCKECSGRMQAVRVVETTPTIWLGGSHWALWCARCDLYGVRGHSLHDAITAYVTEGWEARATEEVGS